MIEGIDWSIAGVRVDFVTMDQPERTRGESVTLECVIDGASTASGSTTVLGGSGGTTYGGPEGGTYSTDTADAAYRRYRELRAYGEYAGEGASYQLIGGTVSVHENPQSEWPVESHIVPVEPGPDVYHTPGFWALLEGYDDESVVLDDGAAVFEIALEMTFLADRSEFDSREDLLEALSPVTVQYPV